MGCLTLKQDTRVAGGKFRWGRESEVSRFQSFKVPGADRISESLLSSGVNGFPAVVRNPVEAAGRAGGMGSFDSFGWRLSSLRMTEYFWELLFRLTVMLAGRRD